VVVGDEEVGADDGQSGIRLAVVRVRLRAVLKFLPQLLEVEV